MLVKVHREGECGSLSPDGMSISQFLLPRIGIMAEDCGKTVRSRVGGGLQGNSALGI